MMSMESTYQGYISSTHDALLVFECVRRGILPKVKRRLREEERKYIRSGQVFVFDERESGIKRWTDGLLWSPSRILWNFLVYRQVDKKFGGRGGLMQDSSEDLNPTVDSTLFRNEDGSIRDHSDAYALGVEPLSAYSDKSFNNAIHSISRESISPMHHDNASLPIRVNINSSASTLPTWQHKTPIYNETVEIVGDPTRKEAQDERNLVGSLRSSYPFARGGLCKKTISIQVDGSTQHLISYYTVDDVRSGRLRTPASLTEIASLAISPQLLTKTSFRFPPAIVMGPDGIPRFRSEEGGRSDDLDGNDGGVIGRIDYKQMPSRAGPMQQIHHSNQDNHYSYSHFEQSQSQAQAIMATQNNQQHYGGNQYSDINLPSIGKSPLPHQIGGSGNFEPSKRRRSSIDKRVNSMDEEMTSRKLQRLPKSSFTSIDELSNIQSIAMNMGQPKDSNTETRQQLLQQMLAQQEQDLQPANQISQRYLEQPRIQPSGVVLDTYANTDWPHSDEAAMMKMAVVASAPKSTNSRGSDQGQQMEDHMEPPPQYMPVAPLRVNSTQSLYWPDDQAYSQRHPTITSASVSPLPSHAPLAFVPSQRPSTAAPRPSHHQPSSMPIAQGGQMSTVSHWTQEQPNQSSPSGPAYINLPGYDSSNLIPATQTVPLQYSSRPQVAHHRPMTQAMLIQSHQNHTLD